VIAIFEKKVAPIMKSGNRWTPNRYAWFRGMKLGKVEEDPGSNPGHNMQGWSSRS
jgi:hypothetical protein